MEKNYHKNGGLINILKSRGKYAICIGLTTILLSTSAVFGAGYKATVVAPDAVVRQDKAFDSKQMDKLGLGDKVTVKEVLENWYRVEAPGSKGEGWVSVQEIAISDSSFKENSLKRGTVVADVLNVRIGPSTSHKRLTQVRNGDLVTIINTSNTGEKWYEVILSNNLKGWVHSDYIKLTYKLPKASINTSSVALRQKPDKNGAEVSKLSKSETVYIKNYNKGWYNVATSQDKEGWIENKYVTISTNAQVSRSASGREVFSDIGSITGKYLGKRYAYGGNGPNSFDCSGFTSYILKTYYGEYLKLKGINLPRTASAQANIGTSVSRGELQAGDLVFFDTVGRIGDSINHVGIYIGNGKIVHASTSRAQIVVDNLSDTYYTTRFMKATRL